MRHFYYQFVVYALLLTLGASHAEGQTVPSSQQSSPDGGRPNSTQVSLFDLLESGGEYFLSIFQEQNQRSVDQPEWDSYDSPRTAFMTFNEAMDHVAQGRDDAWSRAREAFAEGNDEDTNKQAAIHLLDVIDRLPEISPATLPGKETADSLKLKRFELFPRGIDNAWVYRALDEPPQGSIVLVESDGKWVISEETISGAKELAESLQSIPPRRRLKPQGEQFINLIGPTFWKTSLLGWFGCLVVMALAIAGAWLCHKSLSLAIDRLRDLGDDYIFPLLQGVRLPLIILIITFGFTVASGYIHFEPAISTFRWAMIEVMLVIALLWLFVEATDLAIVGLTWAKTKDEDDPYFVMSMTVVRRIVRIAVCAILGMFILQNVFGWDVTVLLGGFGLIALALSLAAKDAVQNLFGALTIFANKPFLVGDWIIFNKEVGEVEDVSLQVTRIRLLSGEVWSVPNMQFVNQPVENLHMRKYYHRVLEIGLTFDTPPDKVDRAIEILLDILTCDEVASERRVDLDDFEPKVNFTKFNEASLNLRVDYCFMFDEEGNRMLRDSDRGWFDYLNHCTLVNRMIHERFREEEIEFAFPTQTLYVADDPKRKLEVQYLENGSTN